VVPTPTGVPGSGGAFTPQTGWLPPPEDDPEELLELPLELLEELPLVLPLPLVPLEAPEPLVEEELLEPEEEDELELDDELELELEDELELELEEELELELEDELELELEEELELEDPCPEFPFPLVLLELLAVPVVELLEELAVAVPLCPELPLPVDPPPNMVSAIAS
jgi:hypothetical protein